MENTLVEDLKLARHCYKGDAMRKNCLADLITFAKTEFILDPGMNGFPIHRLGYKLLSSTLGQNVGKQLQTLRVSLKPGWQFLPVLTSGQRLFLIMYPLPFCSSYSLFIYGVTDR